MSIRVSALVLMIGLALTGCPGGGGDGEDEDDGNAGASGAGAGEGGRSGASGASGGGGAGNSGASGMSSASGAGGGSNLSPEDVAAGSCDMMGGGETECTGVEEYMACLNTQCGYDECYEGPCAGYIDCLSNADDPCVASQNGTCSPSSECLNCFVSDANCALSCASNLECAGGEAGAGGAGGDTGGAGGFAGVGGLPEGTCEDLDACCASLSGQEAMNCMTAAEGARTAGDFACAIYIPAFCPEA